MRSLLVHFLLIVGSLFTFFSALGVLRFPDLLSRLHAASKAASFGIACLLLAVVIYFGEVKILGKGLLAIAFLYLSLPVAAHMIARAGYLLKMPRGSGARVDEYEEHLKSRRAPTRGAPTNTDHHN